MSVFRSFGQRVAFFRRGAGLSQEQLAERAGLSRNYIGLLESARRQPSLQTVLQIQKALGVRLGDLVPEGPLNRILQEEQSSYKDVPKVLHPPSPEHYRLFRRLQNFTPQEILNLSKIVDQVLRFRNRKNG